MRRSPIRFARLAVFALAIAVLLCFAFSILSRRLAVQAQKYLASEQVVAQTSSPLAESAVRSAIESNVFAYTAPAAPAGKENRLTLRLNCNRLELSDSQSGAILRSQLLSATNGVDIRGADGETNDTLTVDYSGGMFSVREGIRYDGGAGGYDTLVITGGSHANETYEQKNKNDGEIALDDTRII